MVAFRALLLGLTALSSAALAASSFEPLSAEDLFGRSAPSFEPLGPSTTRRGAIPAAAGHLPRAHAAIHGRAQSANTAYIANTIQSAIDSVTPIHSAVHSFCSSVKSGSHNRNPVSIISQVQPHLAKCKEVVHHCGNGIGHHGQHPHPSGTPGGPGAGGCSGLLSELIIKVEELLNELREIAADIPLLKSLLEGYIESLDEELADLVNGTTDAIPQAQAFLKSFMSDLTKTLKATGLTSLVQSLGL